MADDETNQILREIRDLLASQESKRAEHLSEYQRMYKDQLAAHAALERRRNVIAAVLGLGLLVFMVIMLSR